MLNLANKTAIITGGGSGIGQAICQLFARQGATVYILDLALDQARQTAAAICETGAKASAVHCDVSNQQQVKQVVQHIYNETSRIDLLVNNAGIAHIGTAEDTAEADFDRLMKVNVNGVYNCIHACLPFLKLKGGVILNMASVAAWVGIPNRFAYSTTKGAIAAMTVSVAKDYLDAGIRCNSISPGRVHTPFVDGFLARNYPGQEAEMFEKLARTQPIGRMGKPEEIAQLALYLCSDEASFITGTDYPIDGGFITLNN